MMLIALLVFLVLRQVMPIASGLAGGASLNSFGAAGRSFSWAARRSAGLAGPVLGLAVPYAARSVGVAAQGTGQMVRNVTARTGEGMQALARSWRNWHR